MSGVFLYCFSPYGLRQGLSPNLGFTILARLTASKPLGSTCLYLPLVLGLQICLTIPSFLPGADYANVGSHDCSANTLFTEPFSGLFCLLGFFFF